MDKAQSDQFVQILQGSRRLNLRDPTHLARAKKILQMANQLKNMQNLPPEINAELTRFYDSVGARPEVAGIKTTITAYNKWEETFSQVASISTGDFMTNSDLVFFDGLLDRVTSLFNRT